MEHTLYFKGPSGVFVKTCEAHTLLGAVTPLLNPASVHLYMGKSADDILWTNLQVILKYPYSDQ